MNKLTMLFLAIFTLTLIACGDDDTVTLSLDDSGLTVKDRTGSVDDVYSSVKSSVESQGFTVVAEVNHSAAAEGIGTILRPTRTIIFGNPEGGTQLMQADQRIGIDLPLKMLVYEDDGDEASTHVAYFDATTLLDRYDIENEALEDNINTALDEISAGGKIRDPRFVGDTKDDLIVKNSTMSAAVTFDSLEAVLIANDFNIVAKVEHDVAAASVGLTLRPTKVIIFGKPEVGTQLMQSNNKIGIDLPLKVLVWEDENGDVKLGYYDASFLTDRYDIRDRDEVVDMINIALSNLTEAVIN